MMQAVPGVVVKGISNQEIMSHRFCEEMTWDEESFSAEIHLYSLGGVWRKHKKPRRGDTQIPDLPLQF